MAATTPCLSQLAVGFYFGSRVCQRNNQIQLNDKHLTRTGAGKDAVCEELLTKDIPFPFTSQGRLIKELAQVTDFCTTFQ